MRHPALLLLSLLLFTGCKVGPDYHSPVTVLPENFIEDKPDETVEIGCDDLVQWWSIFNDPFLNALLDTALAKNFDYRIALEQVFQARSNYWIQFTQILPEFDADALATRYRTSQSFTSGTSSTGTAAAAAPAATAATATISPYHNFYQTGLDAIWEIDLFGKLRRSAEASYDLWEASAEEMRGVKIIVISEVAAAYATICSYQTKGTIAGQVVDLDEELLSLSRIRFDAGLADQEEVESAAAQLEADKAQFALIQASLKQYIYSLAVLLGTLPEAVMEDFLIERPIPQSTGKVPVAIPSELLRRRPDIRAAERELAAATEHIGVAVADLFPSLSLTGSSSSFAANPLQGANIGYSSDTFSKLFRPASSVWGIGGILTMPVFDFGKRFAAVDVQVSLRNQAYYAYQKTVIEALQETEQALEVYFNEDKRLQSYDKEVQANWKILSLTADLFQAGLANYSQVIEAKEIWLTSLNTLTNSQQALTIDLIAIYKALGGDW